MEEFDALQRKLVPLWHSISSMNEDEQTIVVVPSLSLDLAKGLGSLLRAYEERYLFLLFLLRQPRARLVYVTSQPIAEPIIEYYLALMPGVIPSHARRRLHLVDAGDDSSEPLSRKLLGRPDVLNRIRSLIPDPARAHMVPFVTTELERDLALALGIPMYGADPRFAPLGSKSGCRRLFAEENVVHPFGFEHIGSMREAAAAIAKMRGERPAIRSVLVKLNEGIGGLGNLVVALDDLPAPGAPGEEPALEQRIREAHFGIDVEGGFEALLAEQGGAVEERIEGEEVRSPSVQMRATPLGELEILSTHDQMLGGPDGQSYLGCVFPADPGYATLITREAEKVGRRLVREGVLGRFAIDFVVVRGEDGAWTPYAIELNLRKGGTTHPFLTLQFLTDGAYDATTGEFRTPAGHAKSFVASDHVSSPAYRGLSLDDLFDIVVRRHLHFDQSRQSGVVMHMMSAVTEHGSLGLTAVGDTAAEARDLYDRAVAILDEETRR